MPSRRSPNSWTTVRLPERELAASILELAEPLLGGLGPAPSIEEARAAIELAVGFWNASVAASKVWGDPRPGALRAMRSRMCGRRAGLGDASTFDLLTARWRARFELDPRIVVSWTYEADAEGVARLVCAGGLPEGVSAVVPPPAEKRIAIGGMFLDDVRIRLDRTSSLNFPAERHSGAVGEDGSATVYAMMPSARQLFAEGRLPRVGGAPVEVLIGGQQLGPMLLAEVRCGGANLRYDVAVLVFRPVERTEP